jgi:hypothetical protein
MPAHALRPRSVTELLDAAFHLYRAHFAPLIVLGGVMLLPLVTLGVIAFVVLMPSMQTAAAGNFDITPFLWIYALMPFAMIWMGVMDGAMQIAASDAYLRGEASAGAAVRQALQRGWRIVGATLLKLFIFFAAMIAGGMAVGIAAAISPLLGVPIGIALVVLVPYLYGRLALVPATCVLEDSGATRAIERTISLSTGNGWRIVGGLFLVYIVLVVLQFTVAFGVAIAGLPLVGQVLGQLVWIAGYPIVAVLTMLLYYDLRIRKEGFDLEVMSADLARLPEPTQQPLAARRFS